MQTTSFAHAWAVVVVCLASAGSAHAQGPATPPGAPPPARPPSPPPSTDPAAPPAPADGPTDPAGAPADAPPADEASFEAVAEIEAPARETTKRSVEGPALREIAGTRGDPLRAIEVMPGVGRTGLGDGAPRLRGAAGFDSVTLIDGAPVPMLYHFGGLTSVIHPSLVERVTLYPGNFPVTYGRATGGVVAADVRSPRNDRLHATLDLATVDTSALVEFPIGEHLSFAIAGRRSNIDLFFDAFVPEDAFEVVAAPVYYDYQAIGEARFGPHVLRLFGYGSSDELELLLDEPLPEEPALRGATGAAFSFHRVSARLDSSLDEDTRQRLQLTYGVMDGSQRIAGTAAAFSRHDVLGRATWDAQLTQAVGLRGGFDVELYLLDGDYDGQRPPQLEGDPGAGGVSDEGRVRIQDTVRTFQPATFVELALRPVAPLLLLPGVRVDYFEQIDVATVDPRLAARLELSRQVTLKSGVGLFTQPPLYWESMPGLGNEELDPVRAVQTSAGAEFRLFEEAVLFDVEGYHKQLFDRVVTTEGRTAPYFENDGEGRIFGVETSLQSRIALASAGRIESWLAYSLARSERRERGGAYRLFDEDQTHALTVAGTYHIGDSGWQIGSRFRLVSGHPTTAIEGSVFDAEAGTYRPLFGPTNRERRPAFHQLDVRVEKKWSFEDWSLTGYLELQNAYNAQHEEGSRYSYDYRQSEPVLGLPLFPNLGVRGEL